MFDSLIAITAVIVLIASAIAIARQAGYSVAWLLLLPVPLLNLILIGMFAFRPWPVRKELARLRLMAGEGTEADCRQVMSQAIDYERRGEWELAAARYRLLVAHSKDAEEKAYAIEAEKRAFAQTARPNTSDNPFASPRPN